MNAQGLVVFDFDGTLARGDTVCEVLARPLGKLSRMLDFERLRDQDSIASARAEMAGWYENVSQEELIGSLVNVQIADGVVDGISLLKSHGIEVGIASITWAFAIQQFAEDWEIEKYLATKLHADGSIDHVWPEDKARWLVDLATQLGVSNSRVAAVGDSAGDFEMLQAVGVPIYVGADLPEHGSSWLHWPAAKIDRIAQHLVELWNLS
jgi:HAD superfamily phosphoserine phosphatase-like hydrolase